MADGLASGQDVKVWPVGMSGQMSGKEACSIDKGDINQTRQAGLCNTAMIDMHQADLAELRFIARGGWDKTGKV